MKIWLLGLAGCMMLMGVLRSPAVADEAVLSANGSLNIRDGEKHKMGFGVIAANENWQFSNGVKRAPIEKGVVKFSLKGSSPVDGEAQAAPTDNGIQVTWKFRAAKGLVKFNTLAVSTGFGTDQLVGTTWHADDKSGVFPEKYTKEGIFGDDISHLKLTDVNGQTFEIRFDKPVRVSLLDGRKWSKFYSIRIGKVFGQLAPGETYEIAMTLSTNGKKMTWKNDDEVIILPGQDWVPLTSFLEVKPGSVMDFTNVVPNREACGGKGRLIINKNGHFACEKEPEKELRFYGANLCFDAHYHDKAKTDILLDRWVQMGYNTLRIHHYESWLTDPIWKITYDWSKKRVDQLDYLAAGCVKRGIWLTTDLYVSRPVSLEQVGLPNKAPYRNHHGFLDGGAYKSLCLVYKPCRDDLKKYTKQFLEHVNPYTGNRWADEPALAWISLINEGAPGGWVETFPEWKKAYNQWLAAHPALWEKLKAAGVDGDPSAGSVNFPKEFMADAGVKGAVTRKFLADTEREFIADMRKFLREEIKCKAFITNHNCPPNTCDDLVLRKDFDYVDNHFYIDHPIFEPGDISRCPNGNPIHDFVERATYSSKLKYFGKPMTISEYNFSAPGRYRGMGGVVTGALAVLQDWDILWRFAYAHTAPEIFEMKPIDYFNLARDPLALAADRAAVALFLRGDLKVPKKRVVFTAPNDGADSLLESECFVPAWLSWKTRVAFSTVSDAPAKGALALPIGNEEKTLKLLADNQYAAPAKGGEYVSETGQVRIDHEKGIFIVDTPLTAGGFAPKGEGIKTSGLTVRNITEDAMVVVSSVDNKPLADSARMLVTHLTNLQNTGAHYGETGMQTKRAWGGLPHLVRDGQAEIALKHARPESLHVWAVTTAGHRIEEIPAKAVDGGLVFTVKVRGKYTAVMQYEITAEKVTADPIVNELTQRREEALNALNFTFEKPFLFAYGSFEKNYKNENGAAVIKTPDSKGGAGYNKIKDFTAVAAKSPVLYLRLGAGNQAKTLKVLFMDNNQNKATFLYSLEGLKAGGTVKIKPRDNAVMERPNEGKCALGNMMQMQILGDWSAAPLEVSVEKLVME